MFFSVSHKLDPLPTTVTDFWRLVWQEKVKVIVILTNVVEGGKQKCEQYWPDQEPQEYGPFTVTLVDQQVFADYIIRILNVMVRPVFTFTLHTHLHPPYPANSYNCTLSSDKHAEKRSLRSVFQIHFRAWPDHGVPEYAGPILTFLHRVNAQLSTSKGPLLIHCRYMFSYVMVGMYSITMLQSVKIVGITAKVTWLLCSSGVGRTGTLITIDIALEQAAKEGAVDIPAVVYKIRRQRMKMVQTVVS